MDIERLRGIKLFLLDMDGTIYLGSRLLPCTIPFLELLKAQGERFTFLTNNSSKNRDVYVEKLGRIAAPDDVFTSGEVTTIHLNKIKPGARVYLAGTPALESEFTKAGFILTDEAPDLMVLGFDMTLTCSVSSATLPGPDSRSSPRIRTSTAPLRTDSYLISALCSPLSKLPPAVIRIL